MQTRLSLFCEGVIEATTLAAVVLVPLFFNTTSSTVFELDKAVLVRVLAWLAVLAWLVQRLERHGSPWALRSLTAGGLKDRLPPLTVPAMLVILAAVLASLFSIAPRVSLLGGTPERAQGLYTRLAYVVLFLAARHTLRTRHQVARLITAVVVTSLPIALYMLVQALELDPIHWPMRAAMRPSSSIGNPIFVGEYLMMVLPLTIVALITAWRAVRRQAGSSRYLVVVALVVLMGFQLAAIVVTQSRGPFLGLLAGASCLGLLLAVGAGKRRLLGGLVIAALAVVGLLLFISLPQSPLAAVREIPYLGRLAEALDPETATAQVRILQWEAGISLVTSNPARLLVGYGPDTTRYAIGPFTSPDLMDLIVGRRTDRVHNEFLDILVVGGLVSLAAYLTLFLSAMRLGLTRLGLLGHRPQEARLLAAVSLGGGLLAALTAWMLTGTPAFLAPVFGLGLVLGLSLYLLARPFLAHLMGPTMPLIEGEDQQFLVAGLLAALVGHLIAFQFSFGVVVTLTLFWIYLALLAAPAVQAVGTPRSNSLAGHRRRRERRPAPSTGELGPAALVESAAKDHLARSVLLGLILGVLLADFLLTGVDFLNPIMLGMVGLTWVLGGVLTLAGVGEGLKLDRSGLTWPVLSLGWGLLFPCLLALIRLRPVLDPTVFYLLFLAWLGLILAGLAVVLSRTGLRRLPLWRSSRWPLYLGLALAVSWVVVLTNLNAIRADINAKMAEILSDAGQLDSSIAFYRRALALAPDHDGYYSSLAQTHLDQAKAAADARQRTAALEEALQAMKRATELTPEDAVHYWNLGLLYRLGAAGMADPAGRRAWLEQGLDSLHRAIALEPSWASLYVEQAQAYLALERYEEAVEASREALTRGGHSAETYALLGDAYLGLGQLAFAEESYRQALTLRPKSAEAHRGMAALYLSQGKPEAAQDEALAALSIAPHDYATLKTLALAHQALGSIQEALDVARQARDFAPPSQRATLETLIAELEEAQTR